MFKTTYLTNSLLHIQYSKISSSNKIAGFDLDHTLIKPLKNKKFPNKSDKNDWTLCYKNVKTKLKKLYDEKYKIIIHTNQKKIDKEVWIEKVKLIFSEIDVPCEIYCALEDDEYRKPLIFAWKKYIKYETKNSFYCGDAMGRPHDHSDTDYKLALNLKLNFIPPEKMFEDKEIKIPKIDLELPLSTYTIPKEVFEMYKMIKNNTFIINMGYPGCGKSTFVNLYLKPLGFVVINQDTLTTLAKCKKIANESLKKNKNIVIDNTNLEKKTRDEWQTLAEKYNYHVIILYFNASIFLSKHNNIYRYLTTGKKMIPQVAYNVAQKKFQRPIGDNVVEILPHYKINKLMENKEHEELYHSYLL